MRSEGGRERAAAHKRQPQHTTQGGELGQFGGGGGAGVGEGERGGAGGDCGPDGQEAGEGGEEEAAEEDLL